MPVLWRPPRHWLRSYAAGGVMGVLSNIWPWNEFARLRELAAFHCESATMIADKWAKADQELREAKRREELRLAMRRDRDRRRKSATNADMIAKLRSEEVAL
ncbi:hypothetical protein ABC347_07885 [Sphingomonas sp. 1P06PA]|uniref:hypothetical protein n=1 Tax=Sphingomonas sp. 1P06PA TaxID=554121 RepID=UPI0039A648B6